MNKPYSPSEPDRFEDLDLGWPEAPPTPKKEKTRARTL